MKLDEKSIDFLCDRICEYHYYHESLPVCIETILKNSCFVFKNSDPSLGYLVVMDRDEECECGNCEDDET